MQKVINKIRKISDLILSTDLFFLGILIIIFMLLACYRLGRGFPPGLNHDSAWAGSYAVRVLSGEPFRLFIPEGWGKLTLSTLIIAALIKLFGVSKEMIELHSTIYGLLGIISFYFLTFSLAKNKALSFFLSLLLIFSSAFILFSRAGWSSVGLIPFANLILASSILYLEKPNLKCAALLGISSGFSLYIYDGARLSLIFFLIFWGVLMLTKFKTKERKQSIINFFFSLFFLILILTPLGIDVSKNWQAFNGRAQFLSSNNNIVQLLKNFKTGFLFYNKSANGNDFFVNFPVLEGPVSYLWILGFLIVIIDFRKYWVIILLFFTYLLPSVLTAPGFHRAIGTLPIVIALACLPIIKLFNFLMKKNNKSLINLSYLFLIITISFQAYYSIDKLYIKKLPFLWGFYPETTVAAKYLRKIGSDREIIIYAINWPSETLTYLGGSPFKNYQNYNTASHGGMTEIIRDLKNGVINQEKATFVVEKGKETIFKESLSENKFAIQNIDTVKSSKGVIIAEIFKLLLYK